jgi:selenocysteine lyase/cysteine desulfurase
VSTAAFGIGLKSGDHIALVEGEYPSDALSWMLAAERAGAIVDFYPANRAADPESWVKDFHPRTRVCNVSHVSFQTGTMLDIKSLGIALAERDILFVVDATQSFGGMPIDPSALALIDVMPCSTYKWMLAPYGQALCYWSEKAVARIAHMQAGWLTMPQSPHNLTAYTKEVRPGARKFDRGQTPNVLTGRGLAASVGLLSELGLVNIYQHNQRLVSHFVENYSRQQYQLVTKGSGSNILCLKANGMASAELQARLRQAGIDVSVREGNVRISFHLYNRMDEVDALLSV